MSKKPNIIVFMTDQQNGDTVKTTHPAITPCIDAFKQNALHFQQTYTASPHCCPSRASFFSGLYPSEHGVWNNVEVDNSLSRGLFDDVTLFPETLDKAGYNTYFTGKWHVTALESPAQRGFNHVLDERVTNYERCTYENKPLARDWENVYSGKKPIQMDETKKFGELVNIGYPKKSLFSVTENPYGDRDYVRLACEAIQNDTGEKPFFMYVGATGPHDPYIPPQEFLDLYKDVDIQLPPSYEDDMLDKPALYRRTREQYKLTREECIEGIRHYLAFVSFEDHLFGQVVQAVKDKGILEDTYIIYVSDHGDYLGAHRLWAKGLPSFREGYHVPLIIGGKDIKGARTTDALTALVDIAPTIAQMAGLDFACSGQSVLPYVQGETPDTWRTELFTQTNGNEIYGIQRAVWNRKYKYVWNTFDYDELYDLENDPHEMHNIATLPENQPIIKQMCKKMWAFAKDKQDNCTCEYIMVSLSPYGPGILLEDEN